MVFKPQRLLEFDGSRRGCRRARGSCVRLECAVGSVSCGLPFRFLTLAVFGRGTLALHGTPRHPSWLQLNETAAAQSRELRLSTAPSWPAGAQVVLASSDFDFAQAEVTYYLDNLLPR